MFHNGGTFSYDGTCDAAFWDHMGPHNGACDDVHNDVLVDVVDMAVAGKADIRV